MANPNDNIRRLYQNGLKHFSLPDFETFQQDMKDEEKRRRFYTNMQEAYSLPDFDTFSQDIGAVAPAQPQPQAAQAPAQPQQTTTTVKPITDNTAASAAVQPTVTTASQPEQPTGWQPTWQQRMAFDMQVRQGHEQLQRQADAGQQRMAGIKKGNLPGAFMGEREFNPQSGQMEAVYYTQQGERVGSRLQQSQKNAEYHTWWENNTEAGRRSKEQRLQREFDDRLANLWQRHNPTEGENAAEKAWSAAESAYSKRIDANRQTANLNMMAVGNSSDAAVVSQLERLDNFTDRLTTHDLDNLMNNAWANLGEDGQQALIDDCHKILRYRYPGTDDLVLYKQAQELARQQSDLRLYNLAVEKNAPKNALEYFMRKVSDANLMTSIGKGIAVNRTGKTGDMAAYEAANEQYRQDGHRILDVAGTVTGMALDPTMWMSGGVGGVAGKSALSLGGRWLAGRGASAAVKQAATRQLATSMSGRILGGVVGGSANFGTFEGIKEMENQFVHGGHIVGQDETGRYINEGYSASAVAGQVGHGLVMGAAIGWITPVSGNVADKLVRGTSSTVGKAAERAGLYAGATTLEGTIFSVPEWIEGERDAMDVWTDNMAMMVGFKAKHMLKSAGGVLGDLKASFDSPTNGRKNRLDFESRLRMRMDAPSGGGLALTKDERAELERNGYGNLRELVESAERNGNAAEGSLITENAPEIVSRLTDMVTDSRVSEAARAKMYYYATGRKLPESTIMRGEMVEDGNGGFIVESQGANGVITSRTFSNRKAADLELERIRRQAELNHIEIGERYQQTADFEKRLQDACRTVAAENGWDMVEVYRVCEEARRNHLKGVDKQLDEARQNILGKVVEAVGEFEETSVTDAMRGRINEKYGVDIDKAIRKDANRRTQAEQTAIDEYLNELIPNKAKDRPVEDADAEDITNQKFLTDETETPADKFGGGEPVVGSDPHQPGGEQKPIGRAVMKFQDRPVEVLSGRIVLTDDGTMLDNAASDKSIVIRDLATGKIEMVAPEAILSYEEYPAAPIVDNHVDNSAGETPAEETPAGEQQKYSAGQITIRNSDGTTTRGWLTGEVDEEGKFEYYVEGDLQHLHYASGQELDNIITDFKPDAPKEPEAPAENVPTDGNNGSENIPAYSKEYEQGYTEGMQEVHNYTDEQLNSKIESLTTHAERLTDFGKGWIAALEHELQRRQAEAQPQQAEGGTTLPQGITPVDNIAVPQRDGSARTFTVGKNAEGENVLLDESGFMWGHDGNGGEMRPYRPGESVPTWTDEQIAALAPQQTEAPAPVESVPETPETVPNPAENAVEGVEIVPEAVPTAEPAQEQTPLQRIPRNEKGEPIFEQAETPEHGWDALVEFAEGDKATAKEIADTMAEEKRKAFEKAQKLKSKGKTPTEILASRKANAAELAKAQNEYEQWQKIAEVQKTRDAEIRRLQAEERRQRDAEAHDTAVAKFEQEQIEQAQKEAERREVGYGKAMPNIVEKYNNAEKVYGNEDEIILANGEKIKGRWVLSTADATTPSHDPFNGYVKSEGFPMNENGTTVNDRDYEHDIDAQQRNRERGANFDSRALQNPIINSNEGVVVSGNDRDMAGKIAAVAGTDGKYLEYATKYAQKYGFTPEQVAAMPHARIRFEMSEPVEYTTENFRKFNVDDKKAKNNTEKAVEMGKVISDELYGQIVNRLNGFDTIGEYYNDPKAGYDAVQALVSAGVIGVDGIPELIDGGKLSEQGKKLLESILVGKAFSADPEVVRILTDHPAMRQRVVWALQEIADNYHLGADYSLQQEMTAAIHLCDEALNSGFQLGDPVSGFAAQKGLFPELDRSESYQSATVQMLGNILNHKNVSELKKVLTSYNDNSRSAASGQFSFDFVSGDIKRETKEEIIKLVLEFLQYGTKEQIENARQIAVERRKESVQQDGNTVAVNPTSSTEREGINGSSQDQAHPVGGDGDRSVDEWFGPVYTEFQGKSVEAEEYLRDVCEGVAKGALSYPGLAPIDLAWGDKKAGYMKIVIKHPEVVGKLQEILNSCKIIEQSDNRVVLESDAHRVIVSKMKGATPTDNWLLTAYEKKKKPVSASSSDIETEPEGKRNGTATPQGEPLSDGKVTALSSDKQISEEESSSQLTDDKGTSSVQSAVEAASAEVNTEPTPAQAEAGNYKKGHVSIGDFDITIENPAGSTRKGIDANGKEWSTTMANAYGYIKGTEGVDGDHIDVFLHKNMDEWNGRKVFVVDQTNPDGSFDEHKVMLGFNDKDEAMSAYLANYDSSWAQTHPGLRISETNIEDFDKWIQSSHRKTKPFADYSTVSKETDNEPTAIKGEGYSIAPKPYTNKQGKTLETYLVTFDRDFSKEEMSALRAKAKEVKGWYDREAKGWMLRSEEEAKAFAEDVIGKSEDDIADQAPLSMADMEKQSPVKKVNLDGVVGDLRKKGVAKLSDHAEPVEAPKPKKRSKWISEEDAAEFDDLRNGLRSHLGADQDMVREDAPSYGKPQPKQMDAEVLRMGTRMTYLMMKGGLRKFSDYAEAMVEEVGDAIRPHLKSLYAAAQNMEEVMQLGWDEEMDDRKTVKSFDVYNFDKPGAKDMIKTAQQVVDETESQKQTRQIIDLLKGKRNERRKQEADKTSADTEAIAGKAEATASKVESELETARTEQDAERLNTEIDKQIEEVNKQLALLGEYAKGNEAYNERHAESDAAGLMARLANDLGIDLGEAAKEGQLIRANFGPMHGYVSITLPLKGYEPIKIEISFAKLGKGRVSLETFSVRRTVTNSDNSILGGGTDIKMYGNRTTYKTLLNGIREQFKAELEALGAKPTVSPRHGEDYVDMAGRVAKQSEKDTQTTMGSLFDFDDEAEVSKQITDAVKSDLNTPAKTEEKTKAEDKSKSEPQTKKEVEAPIEKQWAEMKKKHPDALVLMRVGDFYETFGGDAADISKILGLTLTRKASKGGTKIELAGFPHHALDSYLPKLVRAGRRVAICEQLEQPKKVKRPTPALKPKEQLSGTSAEYQEKSDKERDLVDDIRLAIVERITNHDAKPLTMAEVRKLAAEHGLDGLTPTDLQELVERAVSLDARAIAELALSKGKIHPRDGFDRVVNLYEKQPMLTDRDSERVAKQQYSTPVPMGYVMNQFLLADGFKGKSLLEPSAGNGALTIGIPMEMCHVNDIDARRLANLRAMGYPHVTNQDGTLPFAGQYDMVATNPPFGSMPAKKYGLFTIESLEGQMAINALQTLSDNGRAAIIIGGSIGKWPTPYRSNGSLEKLGDRQLFGYLYSHFNVVDIIPIDGKKLYARNGTGYNVRMILIDGRRRDAEGKVIYEATAENRAYPPVMKDARAEAVTTFEELYNRVQDDISRLQTRLDEPVRPDGGQGKADEGNVTPNTPRADSPRGGERQRPVATGERGGAEGSRLGGVHTESTQPEAGGTGKPGSTTQAGQGSHADTGNGDRTQLDARTDTKQGDGNGRAASTDRVPAGNNADRVGQRSGSGDKRLTPSAPVKVQLTDEKVASPHISEANHLMSRMPAAQAMEFESALHLLQAKRGNIDDWLVDELGYADKSDLFRALAAEQIEGVAMAIDKMGDGRGFIIADQTGIGKGRQAASIIRYGVRQGKKPIFFTQKPGLFSDMYRDLCDVGSPDLRPFIFGSKNEANITTRDASGQDITVFKRPTAKETERVFDYIDKHGELPPEYDYAVITYSQIQNGTVDYDLESIDETTGKPKTNPKSYKKGIPAADKAGQRRRNIVEKLAKDNFLILDEAHTAGGQSGTGGFMQSIIADVRGVTYLSATYAKRPDNMPLYAIKTAISESGVATNELISAVAKGGVPLQEIMSRQLVKSGEMVRRERDFTGVSIDWIETDAGQAEEQRKRFDIVAEIFGDIMRFEQEYVIPYLDNMSEEIAAMGEYAEQNRGKKSMGIDNTTFASKLYNLLQQLLFTVKVDAIADRAIKNLEAGRKPIISFVNTMEGFLKEAQGEDAEGAVGMDNMPTFAMSLRKALEGVLHYTRVGEDNSKTPGIIDVTSLGESAIAAYDELMGKINAISSDLPIAPLDAIRIKIEEAGYTVRELSGRSIELAKENGKYYIRNRAETDKKKAAADFNDGKVDVLMVNKTGSTGISLHASEKFADKRQRVMIVAQIQPDVNDEIQMRGRNDRTGQVTRGAYEYLLSSIPAEQRLQMMFASKLKSLDANTTSSQKSSFNDMDIVDVLNKYGDQIVYDYLMDDIALNYDMGNPLKLDDAKREAESDNAEERARENTDGSAPEGFARKALGRLALLSVAEQERVMDEISDRYVKKIRELDERGENDLEISYKDLKAKTLETSVWIPGTDPESGNAFADNVNVEKVEVNILAKPMTLDEVKGFARTFIENDGVSTWDEWVSKKSQEIDAHYNQRMQATEERIRANHKATTERRRAKLIEDGKAQREKGKHSYSDAEIGEIVDKRIEEGRAEAEQQLAERIDRERSKIQNVRNILMHRLNQFKQMQVLAIPDNLTEEGVMNLDPALGVLVGIKFDKKFTLAGSSAVFAPLDGRRNVTVSLKEARVAFPKIFHSSAMMRDVISHFDIERDWNSRISKESREVRYMLTGNILRALVDSEKGEKTKGRIMTYTKEDGEIATGILMPAKFAPSDLQSEVPISEMGNAIRGGADVKSSNGEVTVRPIQRWSPKGEYELLVPRSKQRGGKYYLDDKKLLSLVEGRSFDIPRSGANAVAILTRESLDKVLKHLSQVHGIKVMQQSKLEKPAENDNFAKEPTQRYETEDGRTISYTSENPESYGGLFDFDFSAENARGAEVDSRSRANEVRLEDNPDRTDPGSGLDRSRGEFAVVERVFKETGSFSFTGAERIESADDVAFIFSALEEVGKEHTFAVYVKDGKPTVVELGMGSSNMSIVDMPSASLAYSRIKPDEVYFVHNHPSGNLKCSKQDAQLLKSMQEMCDVPVYGVIINLKTGHYGTFDVNENYDIRNKRTPAKATALTLHTLDKQIYADDYDPEAQPLVRSAKDVAAFLNSHRMGDRAKVSFLILSQSGHIVGNIHTPFTEISTSVRDKARYISDRVIQFGGASAILYGDFDMSGTQGRDYRRLKEQIQKTGNIRLLDVVSVEGNHTHSANDEGLLYEPDSEYGAPDLRFREVEDDAVLGEFAEGKTVTAYRTMQVIDGKLYSPMATKVGGKATPEIKLGKPEQSEEHPEIIKGTKIGRDGIEQGYVVIDKGQGKGTLTVAYNPYIHSSRSVLNDQFSSAYIRPNLVTVEVEVPESELTSGYRAQMAKDAVGEISWHSGSVSGQLADLGKPRRVILTRYDRPVRIVPFREVAEKIAAQLDGTDIAIPYNVVQPQLRAELERLGVAISEEATGSVSDAQDFGKSEYITDQEIERINARQREMAQTSSEAKSSHAEAMAKKFNTPIRIVNDTNELTSGNAERQARMRRSKGFYDPRTGEVVVVVPNNANVEDVAETVFHEVVAHKGLRELIGEENYDTFCDEVYNHLKDELRQQVDEETTRSFMKEPGKGYEHHRRASVDEMFGRMAEKGFEDFTKAERGIWAKLKAKVLEAINKFLGSLKLPKWVKLGDNELRYMLWRSHERLRTQGDYVGMARDAAKREELGLSLRFRDGETGDIWKDRSVGLEERITNAAVRLANNQSGDLALRNDAMRAIGGNLTSLRRAMALQRTFDQTTVKRVADLARILMQNGYLSDMTSGEMQRLISAVKNAVGHQEVKESVQKVMDIMVQNQLRNGEATLRQLLAIRGSKVDARGVEVQGMLDVEGQRTMEVVKKAMSLNEDDINDRIAEALNRMSDSDQTIADQAAIEYAGLSMALDYVQNIAGSKAEAESLRSQIKTAKEDKDAGRLTSDAYKQFVEATEDAIRKNKIERAEAYFNLVGRLSDSLRGSIENAKAFREAEKERVNEIHHNANSDMEGRPTNEHHRDNWQDKIANNGFVQFLFSPLGTFDQILRVFGNKSANGEGYLWNRFMRGWIECRNKELQGVKDKFAQLDDKAAELFGKGKTWGSVIRMERKMPKATVSFWDGGEMRDHELTQGNLLYIYMVDKMSDGRMKLRRMGITEDDIANIENFLDSRFIALGDWLQNEFLVETRNEYNETHKRMFGASMAAIENYFPLKILANARIDKEEDVNQQNRPDGITTKTGSIIKRRVNNLALDITGADALSVILDHITQMEHWNAYAEWNRDLNTLRTYKRFRNQVINMTTVYGGGRKLWEKFNDLSLMAAGEYRPPIANLDKSAVNIAKGVTAAKVSFRIYTALKQFLSAPAYAPEVSIRAIAKSIANPYGGFKWCLDNLPIFRERWGSRISGDPRLLKSDMDWKMWRSRVMELSSRIGMTPNAFVDALTVSIGARAMYEARLKQYQREGYPADMADERAKQDATILFNQTQQSSESPFLSTMQVDRSWLSVLFTVFRNSSMSYTRQEYDALRNLKRNLTPGQRTKSVEFMTKQILRDWNIDPDTASDAERGKAEEAAKKRFRKQIKKDVIRLATFGFILEMAWNLGAYLPYIIFGNDDDEKGKMWDDAITHAYFGSVEGLTGGDVMSSFGNMAASGEWNWNQLSKDMPLASDINNIATKFVGGKNAEAINDIINLLVQSGIGMNPQSITDAAVAITDACGDDPALSHEAAIFVMRVLQVPQSQLDKMYFDEIGLSGEEASKLTPEQLAQRYAEYKVMRGTPLAPWSWDDEERLDKYEKSAKKKMKERLESQGDAEVNEAYSDFEARYNAVSDKVKAAKDLIKTDYAAAAQAFAAVRQEPDFGLYQLFDRLNKQLGRISKMWLTAKSPEEAALLSETISAYRAGMIKALQAETLEAQQSAQGELTGLMQEFYGKYQAMQPQPMQVNR